MLQIDALIALVWPFANGWMLLWALAAALPILIHLWNRRRYNEVAWAATQYLLAALRQHSRRLTIEQLILLAIRVLILLLLAMALADPILPGLPPAGGGGAAGGRTHWVFVIDGSYSMGYAVSGKTRLDAAKQRALALVDQSMQGDGFTLVLMSDPPEVIVRQPAFARPDIVEEIRSLTLPHGGGDLSATLAEVERVLQTAQQQHPRLVQCKVCIFTDLGRATWDAVDSPSCRLRLRRLAEKAELVLFDLDPGERENVAVTRLEVPDALVTVGRDVTFQAEIENFGRRERKGQRVRLLVDGRTVDQAEVDLPVNGRASLSLVHRFVAPGEHQVEVRTDQDPLGVDNHRWISLPVRKSIEALCVQGKPGSARYVALALQPARSDRPRVRARTAPENAIVEMDLNRFDCVFLCNVGRFGRDEANLLYAYLKNGGGLVFCLGDQVQADSYNRELGGELSGKRVLPARLLSVAAEAQYRFDPLEYRHPIVAPFRGHEQAGLLTTPVWKYFKLAPYEEAKVALAFQGGDPAIVEAKILRGRSILYAGAVSDASVDRSTDPPTPWTAIHSWPSFPPLVQEMLSLAIRGKTVGRNVQVGDDLEGVVHGTVADIPLTLVTPGGQQERVRMTIDGEDSRWLYGGTRRSGIYEARLGRPLNQTQLFAVNLDPRESSLERFDPDLLPSQFRRGPQADHAAPPKQRSAGRAQLFQYVLAGLLVLLFAETILAWSFGRARL